MAATAGPYWLLCVVCTPGGGAVEGQLADDEFRNIESDHDSSNDTDNEADCDATEDASGNRERGGSGSYTPSSKCQWGKRSEFSLSNYDPDSDETEEEGAPEAKHEPDVDDDGEYEAGMPLNVSTVNYPDRRTRLLRYRSLMPTDDDPPHRSNSLVGNNEQTATQPVVSLTRTKKLQSVRSKLSLQSLTVLFSWKLRGVCGLKPSLAIAFVRSYKLTSSFRGHDEDVPAARWLERELGQGARSTR
ncbi:hypothetical protein ON010_g17642 [Phytophthora cinnamomi]|nr:hypothetical protein ON010_g17642 [Phytophthora cinnamomi]